MEHEIALRECDLMLHGLGLGGGGDSVQLGAVSGGFLTMGVSVTLQPGP